MKVYIRSANCIKFLSKMEENSVSNIICDPPYGLEFIEGLQNKSRNLMNPNSQADKDRKALYEKENSYRGRVSNLPDLSKFNLYGKQVEEWHLTWVSECYRVLKSGGEFQAFSSSKTAHRLFNAVERACFQDITISTWIYKSGLPKARNLGTAEGWYTALKPSYEPIIIGYKK